MVDTSKWSAQLTASYEKLAFRFSIGMISKEDALAQIEQYQTNVREYNEARQQIETCFVECRITDTVAHNI